MKSSKVYDPKKIEGKIYDLWLRSGFLNPDKLLGKRKKSYTILMPPPNITGSLHMGHALNALIQDILIRWKRLQGFKTLWLPGTDHAGIATQVRVEKELKKEGKTRFDLGRKKFLKRVWQWKGKYGNIILDQLKKLGVSCDWSRTRFTMDKKYCQAVKKVFLYYYKKGWIYRGERVVNWCPRCQTSLSDLELDYKEKKGKLWYIRYPLINQKPEYITVATTRPETMLGDTAIAVNPKDKRYKHLIGKKAILPIQNRKIPIIADAIIDLKFGSGALKVTPAHDLTDWEIGRRHKLRAPKVIDEQGRMTNLSKICEGLIPFRCREKVIEELKKKNLIQKVEDYTHSLPHCYRCHSLIEPIPSEQWFLKIDNLAKKAMKAVKSGKIEFIPKHFEKIYFDWLKNIRDWCISRQIWWGQKIPIKGVKDVLDTWFSSALWPFVTLGWPPAPKGRAQKSDLEKFYPTNTLSTDRGIINLWVSRMIFSGLEFMKEIPFETVYIHATVLTREGKRMSKSLGIGVDPINLIKKYGADATRFGIVFQIMGSQDIRFVEDNIVMGRKFCNKIWNAARFVLMQTKNTRELFSGRIPNRNLTLADKKILNSLNKTIKSVDKDLKNFHFGQAAHELYEFFWHDFCDKYIEAAKSQMQPSGESLTPLDPVNSKFQKETEKILLYVLLTSLKLLHPFIPFITEEIYQRLPIKNKEKSLMVEEWPKI